VTLVIVGYLTAWLLFGVAAHLLDWGVNEAVRQSVWLGLNGWVLGVLVLGIAGVFQFTDLKYRCLDRCRAPLSFIFRQLLLGADALDVHRWHGQRRLDVVARRGDGH
jgi:predicted metal-binding membrane protein